MAKQQPTIERDVEREIEKQINGLSAKLGDFVALRDQHFRANGFDPEPGPAVDARDAAIRQAARGFLNGHADMVAAPVSASPDLSW
jgi:hypothetical protein